MRNALVALILILPSEALAEWCNPGVPWTVIEVDEGVIIHRLYKDTLCVVEGNKMRCESDGEKYYIKVKKDENSLIVISGNVPTSFSRCE